MKKNYFNFQKIKNKYLLTNDIGRYVFLDKNQFYKFIRNDYEDESDLVDKLKENYFIYDSSDYDFIEEAGQAYREYRKNLFQGAALHIFVLTRQCNQQCVYCQASAALDKSTRMTKETAKKAVDIALQAPAKYITFEFQGGEPLMNFETLQFIVEYAENQKKDKHVEYSIVSNLMLLDEKKLDFLVTHNVSICTSLDGDEILHNRNRPYFSKNAFLILSGRIAQIRKRQGTVAAIQTTTKYSFERYKELVDQYVEWGLEQITIRPLTPLGFAKSNWNEIGYTVEEFLEFYKKVLEYILELNKKGIFIIEGHARIFLSKIFQHDAGNYMELRSPCGGAVGQMAYYYNGKVYSCDEARMLAEMGDDSFCLGNVDADSYNDLINSSACRILTNASCLEGLMDCCECVFHPYCGTCPVISYARYGTVYPNMLTEYRCSIYKGIQELLFEKLSEEHSENIRIFRTWCQ